jgi:hypothetical protein
VASIVRKYPLQGVRRFQDGDSLEGMQTQQITVAGGDEVGFRGQRTCNNGVIIGIGGDGAGNDRRGDGTR